MKTIGIDTDNYLVYEGRSLYGHGVWPSPSVLPAIIFDEHNGDLTPSGNVRNDLPPFILIDDGYDPTSRVRKGRIYEKRQTVQPCEWHVYPHPAAPDKAEKINPNGVTRKQLATYCEFNFYPKLKELGVREPLIILGSNLQFTIWSVIDVETSMSSETILFLKARKTIGVIPKIDYSVIDEQHHSQIRGKLDILSDEVHRAGPDSIVNSSREAACAIINTYLLSNEFLTDECKDLGQLVMPLQQKAKKYIVANCADTLAKLHSRTKYTEQENNDLRPVDERDAELAVQSIGIILREFDWISTQDI